VSPLYSQNPATWPYPEPDQPSPCSPPPSNLSKIHFNRFRCFLQYFLTLLISLRWGIVSTSPNPQVVGPPIVGCLGLLIQYIISYCPYLEAFSPSATWGRAMPWWQGPTYHGWVTNNNNNKVVFIIDTVLSMRQEISFYR
jgi:hypothetical protein